MAICVPLLTDIFLYSYEAGFIQSLLSVEKKQLASEFNFDSKSSNIDAVFSIYKPDFETNFGQMYSTELEFFKDMTESNTSESYLDLVLSIERDVQLRTCLYDKSDDSNLHNTNIPVLGSNIQALPRPCLLRFLSHSSYDTSGFTPLMHVLFQSYRLNNKVRGQRYASERLKSSLRTLYGRYGDLI